MHISKSQTRNMKDLHQVKNREFKNLIFWVALKKCFLTLFLIRIRRSKIHKFFNSYSSPSWKVKIYGWNFSTRNVNFKLEVLDLIFLGKRWKWIILVLWSGILRKFVSSVIRNCWPLKWRGWKISSWSFWVKMRFSFKVREL